MWSTPTELYPVIVQPSPVGHVHVAEPQTNRQDVPERFSVQRITGVVAYKQRGPSSTRHWVARI